MHMASNTYDIGEYGFFTDTSSKNSIVFFKSSNLSINIYLYFEKIILGFVTIIVIFNKFPIRAKYFVKIIMSI